MQFLLPLSIITFFFSPRPTISGVRTPVIDSDLSTFRTGDVQPSTRLAKLENGDVIGPEDYDDDIDKFMYEQTRDGTVGVNLFPMGDDEDPATALEYEFLGQEWNMAVNIMQGCTMMIVISENHDRLWAAHLFEVPGFTSGAQFFQDKIITPILKGNPDPDVRMPGLLPNKERFGTNPITAIVSTRKWLSKEEYDFKFKNEVKIVQSLLRSLWPHIPPIITEEYEKQIKDSAYEGTALGKLLIQYGPGLADGQRQAMVRVWLEDGLTPLYADYWDPKANQIAATSGLALGKLPIL